MSGKSNVCKPPHMHQHSLWVWLHLSIGHECLSMQPHTRSLMEFKREMQDFSLIDVSIKQSASVKGMQILFNHW